MTDISTETTTPATDATATEPAAPAKTRARKSARAPATATERRAAYAYLAPPTRVRLARGYGIKSGVNPHRPGSHDRATFDKVARAIEAAGPRGATWADLLAAYGRAKGGRLDAGYMRKMAVERGYFVLSAR